MPRKKRDLYQSDGVTPAGDAPNAPTVVIREQISQMAPVTRSDMENAPDNTDAEVSPLRGPNGRLLRKDGTERARRNVGSRKQSTSEENPLMNDPRYVEAIQGLNFYGAPRILKRGFKGTAKLLHDPDIELNADEERNLDNYFYALSKHMTFDPMAHLLGRLILFTLLMGELILWRYLKYTPFGDRLKKMLKPEDENPDDTAPVM